jgi:hypothetical protein
VELDEHSPPGWSHEERAGGEPANMWLSISPEVWARSEEERMEIRIAKKQKGRFADEIPGVDAIFSLHSDERFNWKRQCQSVPFGEFVLYSRFFFGHMHSGIQELPPDKSQASAFQGQ